MSVHFVESDQAAQLVVEDEHLKKSSVGRVQKVTHGKEWKASLQVNNNAVEFKLDTGTQANIIASDIFNSFPAKARRPIQSLLRHKERRVVRPYAQQSAMRIAELI